MQDVLLLHIHSPHSRTNGRLHETMMGLRRGKPHKEIERRNGFAHRRGTLHTHEREYEARLGTHHLRMAQQLNSNNQRLPQVTISRQGDHRVSTNVDNERNTIREHRISCRIHRFDIDVQQPFRPPDRLAWLERVVGLPSPARSSFLPLLAATGKEGM
ncbi:hypothetical protein [Ochrobactrum sp. POC9]|uniref:hypothetical protein n=1 Tax=Ochrobactrum sp. POC9 TaxID=2203419 RepID=UPI0011B1DCF8|nr:hypothetical protein [Ochrobactrum sp. POC9]